MVAANINSYNQSVVGGASKAVEQAIELFEKKGFRAMRIPVSHAFHTKIVAPASKPLRKVLDRLSISSTQAAAGRQRHRRDSIRPRVEGIKDILELQIASPVQWVKGLETMYREGVRTFVEVGPKRALKGFVDDVLGDKPDVWSLLTNHPKNGEIESFNQALCGLYAAGYGVEGRGARGEGRVESAPIAVAAPSPAPSSNRSERKCNHAATGSRYQQLRWARPCSRRCNNWPGSSARPRPSPLATPLRPQRRARSARSSSPARGWGCPAPTSRSWIRTMPCASCAASSSST